MICTTTRSGMLRCERRPPINTNSHDECYFEEIRIGHKIPECDEAMDRHEVIYGPNA